MLYFRDLLRVSLMTLTLGSIACVATEGSSSEIADGGVAATGPRVNRNLVTRSEIRPAEMRSAYDVVTHLRPHWLFRHGVSGHEEGPLVLVGEVWFGTAASLRDISAETIEEIRYLDARDATTRFGSGHTTGVIVVTLRRS